MLQNSLAIPTALATQRRAFVVAQNDRGQWVARETHGLIEGVFLTQRDAIRFALFETGSNRASVVVDDAGASRHH